MQKRELSFDEIQVALKNTLYKLDEVTKKAQVTYYLAYGTLIGAVRHHDIIPWDDDADTMMLRDNYNRFEDYCISHASELYPYKFFSRKTVKGYPYTIGRFVDTRYHMESEVSAGVDMGIFVDVYPLDGFGNNRLEVKKRYGKYRYFYLRLAFQKLRSNVFKSGRGWKYNIKHIPDFLLSRCFSQKYILDKLECLGNKYDIAESKYIGEIVWDGNLDPYEKSYFNDVITLQFGDEKLCVPKDYDRVLKNSYGDYMQLPPLKDRKPTHYYKIYLAE